MPAVVKFYTVQELRDGSWHAVQPLSVERGRMQQAYDMYTAKHALWRSASASFRLVEVELPATVLDTSAPRILNTVTFSTEQESA